MNIGNLTNAFNHIDDKMILTKIKSHEYLTKIANSRYTFVYAKCKLGINCNLCYHMHAYIFVLQNFTIILDSTLYTYRKQTK